MSSGSIVAWLELTGTKRPFSSKSRPADALRGQGWLNLVLGLDTVGPRWSNYSRFKDQVGTDGQTVRRT